MSHRRKLLKSEKGVLHLFACPFNNIEKARQNSADDNNCELTHLPIVQAGMTEIVNYFENLDRN